jgi:Sulfotransferase family
VRLVTYRAPAGNRIAWREPLREIAGFAPDDSSSWAGRQWRIDGTSVCGQYLFSDRSACDTFLAQPWVDAAYRLIADRFGPALEADTRDVDPPDTLDRPVIIIGAPRSGTTLLYELLRASGELWSLDGEAEGVIEGIPWLHPAARGFDSHRLTDLDADERSRCAVIAGFLAGLRDRTGTHYLDDPPSGPVRILDKTPENSLRIPFLTALFPTAKFVLIHRDARQAVSSICQAWRHPGFVKYPRLPGWNRGSWHLVLPEGWRELTSASLTEIGAFQWAASNRRALDDLDALPATAWISIDYAELVAMPAAVLPQVCEFAEVTLDEHLAAVLSRPLPLSSTTITPPSALKWRSNRDFQESSLERYTAIRARLRDLGRLSAPPPPPPGTPGPTRFACFLDDAHDHARETAGGSWLVAPSFRLQIGSSLPVGLASRTRFRDRFLEGYPLIWVTDVATDMTYAYWVSRRDAWRLRGLVPEQPTPSLETDLAARMATVGALVTAEQLRKRRLDGDAIVGVARDDFARTGYALLTSIVPPGQITALGRYYRNLVAAGQWAKGDEQVRLRHGHHNETMARYFHHQLLPVVCRVVGQRVKPSYCYVSAYREGAVLRPHVDRKQCAYTVSLWLDNGTGEPAQPWPLWFEAADGAVSVIQKPGDAVVFLGCDLPHWRYAPTGPVSTALLFHYVPDEFVGTLD